LKKLAIYLFVSLQSTLVFAQEIEDSLFLNPPLEDDTSAYVPQKPKPPKAPYIKRVNRMSFIPGAGQIMNGKYYKAPLFVGAMYRTAYEAYTYHKLKERQLIQLNRILYPEPGITNNSGVPDAFMPSDLTRISNYRNFYLFFTGVIWAANVADAKIDAQIKTYPEKNHKPKKSAMYSALLPGLGQINNGKYWKLPIIYGGAYFMYYYYNLNNEQYNIFHTTYILKVNQPDIIPDGYYIYDTPTQAYSSATASRLESISEKYRKRRERAVIYSFLLYASTIIDAAVDAHLSDFNIDKSIDIAFLPIPVDGIIGLGMHIQIPLDK